ncbi:hypothetical protein TNCV_2760441 [Trichonephila clavipes]|nr:hypothetical protein TNCV_2760441 [Trichonephila clavipes]
MYGESTLARQKAYEWHLRFKESRESIEDNERVYDIRLQKREKCCDGVRKYLRETLAQIVELTRCWKTSFEVILSS